MRLQPGQRLITAGGEGAGEGARARATTGSGVQSAGAAGRGHCRGSLCSSSWSWSWSIYLISSCPRENLGIFNRMSLNFMCVCLTGGGSGGKEGGSPRGGGSRWDRVAAPPEDSQLAAY